MVGNKNTLLDFSTNDYRSSNIRHLIFTDSHAHPQHNNRRAEWLGKLILDVKPDVVIDGGDLVDMPSLSSYDRGKKSFQGRTYAADIAAGHDFLDRVWSIVKSAKKRLPKRVFLEGNHENRIKKAINLQPELEGTIGFDDLGVSYWYDEVIEYDGNSPGVTEINGIHYAHYFISGILGRPVGGEHPAYSLVTKQLNSCVAGHSHLLDYCRRTGADGLAIQGLVAGCFQDYRADWAGRSNDLWWRGLCVLDNVDNGQYDLKTISLKTLEKEYG